MRLNTMYINDIYENQQAGTSYQHDRNHMVSISEPSDGCAGLCSQEERPCAYLGCPFSGLRRDITKHLNIQMEVN